MIARRSRSIFAERGSTTERSVTRGTRRATPNSVAFSTSQSNRSPLGTAVARVSAKRGVRSGPAGPSIASAARSRPSDSTLAR
jgi:hypothetical protein